MLPSAIACFLITSCISVPRCQMHLQFHMPVQETFCQDPILRWKKTAWRRNSKHVRGCLSYMQPEAITSKSAALMENYSKGHGSWCHCPAISLVTRKILLQQFETFGFSGNHKKLCMFTKGSETICVLSQIWRKHLSLLLSGWNISRNAVVCVYYFPIMK